MLIGCATAAHQIEGNNTNSDWWHAEQNGFYKEASADACKSWDNYKRDRKAVQWLGCDSYRLSLEWARIEPEPGIFNQFVIDHYRDVLTDLIKHKITPVVTLHHFTNPQWLEEIGGWTNPEVVSYFLRYAKHVVNQLHDLMPYIITINEPNVMVGGKYYFGVWHPGEKSFLTSYGVYQNLIEAHKKTYVHIKQAHPHIQIGWSIQDIMLTPLKNLAYPINWIISKIFSYCNTHYLYQKSIKYVDFIGLNFYGRRKLTLQLRNPIIKIYPLVLNEEDDNLDQEAADLFEIVHYLHNKFKKPVFITENGTAANDTDRQHYLRGIKDALNKLINEHKVPIIGYLYWSLMDNFEWHLGFRIKFGLFSYNKKTNELEPKASAHVFRELMPPLIKE